MISFDEFELFTEDLSRLFLFVCDFNILQKIRKKITEKRWKSI